MSLGVSDNVLLEAHNDGGQNLKHKMILLSIISMPLV